MSIRHWDFWTTFMMSTIYVHKNWDDERFLELVNTKYIYLRHHLICLIMTKSYLEFLELLGRIWLNIAMMWRKKNMRLDLFTFMLRRTKKGKTNDSNVLRFIYLFKTSSWSQRFNRMRQNEFDLKFKFRRLIPNIVHCLILSIWFWIIPAFTKTLKVFIYLLAFLYITNIKLNFFCVPRSTFNFSFWVD